MAKNLILYTVDEQGLTPEYIEIIDILSNNDAPFLGVTKDGSTETGLRLFETKDELKEHLIEVSSEFVERDKFAGGSEQDKRDIILGLKIVNDSGVIVDNDDYAENDIDVKTDEMIANEIQLHESNKKIFPTDTEINERVNHIWNLRSDNG